MSLIRLPLVSYCFNHLKAEGAETKAISRISSHHWENMKAWK